MNTLRELRREWDTCSCTRCKDIMDEVLKADEVQDVSGMEEYLEMFMAHVEKCAQHRYRAHQD